MRRSLAAALLSFTILPGFALAQAAASPPAAPHGHHGHCGHRHGPMMFLEKFYAANTTHDGHLTLAQAKAGNMPRVADNFTAIDTQHRGYVTLYDIQAWHMDKFAQRLEQRASQLRAKD